MFTDDEMQVLFERVLDRMVESGWLSSYTRTEGKGYWRNWTVMGTEHVELLKAIYESHGLRGDDRLPVAFYELAKGRAFPGVGFSQDVSREVLDFFAGCVDSLGLSGEDEILVMCHIACWGEG